MSRNKSRKRGSNSECYLIYDGDCGLCEACVAIADRYDRDGRFILRPYQSFSVAGLAGLGLTAADCARAVQVVTANGRLLSGARGINYFLGRRRVGRLLNILVYGIPPIFLLELLIYRLVADNRHRLSRWLGLSACRLEPRLGQSQDGDTNTKQSDR